MPNPLDWREGDFLAVTPAGAFYTVAMVDPTPERQLLLHLLAAPGTPRLADLSGQEETLARLSTRGWLRSQAIGQEAPGGTLENLLPDLLPHLSDQGRALLADHQGLAIGQGGFPENEVSVLAALSADAVALGQRARQLINGPGRHLPHAWAMVDAAGNSRIGIWPLFLPGRQFHLVIEGRPLFVRAAFTQLVWILVRRYGEPASPYKAT
ncbi:MAG: hypothetical protein AB1899_14725 [Pseudomonadota bacterium]